MSNTPPINQSGSEHLRPYIEFTTNNLKNDTDIIIGIDGNSVATAKADSWHGRLIQWWRGKELVNDFRTALRDKYGEAIVAFATGDLNNSLNAGMIKKALEKAQAAQAQDARDDIEAYVEKATINAEMAKELKLVSDSYTAKDRLADLKTLAAKVSDAEQHAQTIFNSGKLTTSDQASLQKTLDKGANAIVDVTALLEEAKKQQRNELIQTKATAEYQQAADHARKIVNDGNEQARLAKNQVEAINQKLEKDLGAIATEAQEKIATSLQNSGARAFARGIPLNTTDNNKAQQSITLEATQKKTEACLNARAKLAPLESTLAHYRLTEAAAQAREYVVSLRTTGASTDDCTAAAHQSSLLDQEITLANTMISSAEEAETAAKELTQKNPVLALKIFEAAHMAKVIAINRQSEEAITTAKREIATVTNELSSLNSSDRFVQGSLEEAKKMFADVHADFLLAEANSLEESIQMAQTIASKLNELAQAAGQRAAIAAKNLHPTEEQADLNSYDKIEKICTEAASSYTLLAKAKSIELLKVRFAEEAEALTESASSLKAIQSQVTPSPLRTIDNILAIDDSLPREARLTSLHGKLIAVAPGSPSPTFALGEREAYGEGTNLIRLALAKEFGMNGVKQFDDHFRAQISSKSPITIDMLQEFLSQNELSTSNKYFITTRTTSLNALSAKLAKAPGTQIIKSDRGVSNFNPFTTQSLVTTPALSPAVTKEMEHAENIAATREIIEEAIRNAHNKEAILSRFDKTCSDLINQDKALTVEALKIFVDQENSLLNWIQGKIDPRDSADVRSAYAWHLPYYAFAVGVRFATHGYINFLE